MMSPRAALAVALSSRQERDQLLASAEIILGGFPFPLDLRTRAPRLRWFHQLPAGASNLLRGDLWGSDVVVTTSRGHGNTRPMAEYVLASLLHFARGLHDASRDQARHRFDHRPYRPLLAMVHRSRHMSRRYSRLVRASKWTTSVVPIATARP